MSKNSTFSLGEKHKEKLEKLAEKFDIKMSDMIRRLIDEKFEFEEFKASGLEV